MKKLNVNFTHNESLIGIYPKFWFEENGKKYLFKAPEDDFTDIGEVFATFLYEKLGLNHFVKYEFAKTHDGVEGTICEEHKPKNQVKTLTCWDIISNNYIIEHKEEYALQNKAKLINENDDFATALEDDYYHGFYGQYENSVERIMDNIQKFASIHKLHFDKTEMFNELLNLCIVDFFTANNDRHTSNILFEIVKNKDGNNELQLMPILDNGAIFGLHRKKNFVLGDGKLNIHPRVGISETGTTNENLEKHNIFGNKKQILFDAFDHAKTHKESENLIKKITSLNLPALMEEFEVKEDIEIPKEIKNYMQKSYNARLEILEEYKKQKTRLEKKISNKHTEK